MSTILNKTDFIFYSMKDYSQTKININYFGWQKSTPTQINYKVYKRCYTLHIVIEGKGIFKINNTTYKLEKGNIFLIPPAVEVTYYPDKVIPYKYFWIGFDGENSVELLNNLGFYGENYVICEKNIDEINYMLEKICLTSSDVSQKYSLNATFLNLFQYLQNNKENIYSNIENRNSILKKALKYISENYSRKIKISELSNYLCVERTTLFKLFKHEYNTSPQHYILRFKLQVSQQLICESSLPFKEISEKCGFLNYNNFCRDFISQYKCSPKQMRYKSLNNIL